MPEISLKEIRETFYKCRDFEISNLWQRSIFLTAFLLLCFSGYGIIAKSILENSEKISLTYHIIAAFISIVGMIFSILWIKMGKASKAWYEFYEHQICAIEKNPKLGVYKSYRMGNGAYNLDISKIDSNIFTTNAGIYSPSKINILIGHVCMAIWTIILLIHICIIIRNIIILVFCINNIGIINFILFILFIIGFICIIIFMKKRLCVKSSFLSKFISK